MRIFCILFLCFWVVFAVWALGRGALDVLSGFWAFISGVM